MPLAGVMEHTELLEVLFVEMDPPEDGFSRTLGEVHRDGDWYVLLEIAPATGNWLLRFSSKDKELVYAVFAREPRLSSKCRAGDSVRRNPFP
jgi:hypothetical protein